MTYVTGNVLPEAELNSKPRANLALESAVIYPAPLLWWTWADGSKPDTTGATGNPKIIMGGYSSGTGIFQGQDAHGTTKTETLALAFPLPECYVAAGNVTLTATARYNDSAAGTITVKTLAAKVYKVSEDGTAGADINSTAPQTLTGTMAQYSFTITPATLSPGNLLRIYLQIVLTVTGGTGAQKAEFGGASLKLDIKG